MDPWANFIFIIYISGEKEQKNVLFHHLIQISGEIRHFPFQCQPSTRKCLISPLTKCSISPLALIRWNKISGEIRHFSVESEHRFPVLFLLPRFMFQSKRCNSYSTSTMKNGTVICVSIDFKWNSYKQSKGFKYPGLNSSNSYLFTLKWRKYSWVF